MEKERSFKENRIRSLTNLYYSNQEIQNSISSFSMNREVVPRYFEGFGKRPDSIQYPGDIFEMVKKGATSFHCSLELWSDPLKLETGLNRKQLDELRTGWDLLIDIDSKYLDYSKVSAEVIINFLKFHGIKNIGIKFSGSKGFHIIIPWKAFPQEINQIKTSSMFPEWPRIISKYITEKTKFQLIDKVTKLSDSNKYVKDFSVSEKVMPDIILVSSRHLFRMPYSLHEKTSLSSIVLDKDSISDFQIKDADPLKVRIKNFIPKVKEEEAKELLIQALDWDRENVSSNNSTISEIKEFKPVKLTNISEKDFPPSITSILCGVSDGRKRALFVLINFFRSIGMEKTELEKKIFEWNKKNEVPLLEGYVISQLNWSYRNKIVLPPNYDKDYYNGIGVIPTEEEMKYKNPVNYVIKKLSKEK